MIQIIKSQGKYRGKSVDEAIEGADERKVKWLLVEVSPGRQKCEAAKEAEKLGGSGNRVYGSPVAEQRPGWGLEIDW